MIQIISIFFFVLNYIDVRNTVQHLFDMFFFFIIPKLYILENHCHDEAKNLYFLSGVYRHHPVTIYKIPPQIAFAM